jgi:predicted glycogen debranching enzyme
MVLKRDGALPDHIEIQAWNLQIDGELSHHVQIGLNHEWLVTNGLGGYAAGSIVGAATRSYHGLLVASLSPPNDRVVLVSKVDEEILLPEGRRLQLGVNEYQGGVIEPQGYRYLERVVLEGDIPCFVYRISESLILEKRIWMEYGQNTTYIQYMLRDFLEEDENDTVTHIAEMETPLTLLVSPFCLTRDYHQTVQGTNDWHFLIENSDNRCRIRAYEGAPAYHLIAGPASVFEPDGVWYWRVWHRRDNERSLPDEEDVYRPGVFRTTLTPGIRKTFVFAAENQTTCSWGYGGLHHEEVVAQALMRHQRRTRQVLAGVDRAIDDLQVRDPVMARLVLAADQFIVDRPNAVNRPLTSQSQHMSPDRKTIIAGYPWFTDWGRDSMISLPGLLLCTGRYSEARGVLKAFTSYMHNGLIPNRFPDRGEEPVYNAVDATLWMIRALNLYLLKTGDWTLLKDLFPVLRDSIQWYIHGTEYGIQVDPQDGLLRTGVSGVPLTWMIMPRIGKAVEVNALWYYALSAMEGWAVRLSTDATQYGQLRGQVRQSFAARFWYETGGYLYDVVDVEGVGGQNDPALRPNQLFAASLNHELLTEVQVTSMLQKVTEHLLTPAGLRSLSPTDPAYCARFAGDRDQRESAYHQGTVWQWLIGAYVDVHLRVYNDYDALLPFLSSFVPQLWERCLGTISEVAEPEPPFTVEGCFAQAWSVAEMLRCWQLIRGSIA